MDSLNKRMKERGVTDSIAYGTIVLFGERGEHWNYFEDGRDLDWWIIRIVLFMSGGYWVPEYELYYTLPLWRNRK